MKPDTWTTTELSLQQGVEERHRGESVVGMNLNVPGHQAVILRLKIEFNGHRDLAVQFPFNVPLQHDFTTSGYCVFSESPRSTYSSPDLPGT
jgi:hypothetical protein